MMETTQNNAAVQAAITQIKLVLVSLERAGSITTTDYDSLYEKLDEFKQQFDSSLKTNNNGVK